MCLWHNSTLNDDSKLRCCFVTTNCSAVVKNLPADAGDAGDTGSIPGLGQSPGEKVATHSNIVASKSPWIEEGAWQVAEYGVTKSQTQLCTCTFEAGDILLEICLKIAPCQSGDAKTGQGVVWTEMLKIQFLYGEGIEACLNLKTLSVLSQWCWVWLDKG